MSSKSTFNLQPSCLSSPSVSISFLVYNFYFYYKMTYYRYIYIYIWYHSTWIQYGIIKMRSLTYPPLQILIPVLFVVRTFEIYSPSTSEMHSDLANCASHLQLKPLSPVRLSLPSLWPRALCTPPSTPCSAKFNCFRFHTRVRTCGVCLYGSGFFHSWPMLMQTSVLSFWRQSGFPLCTHIRVLFTHPPTDGRSGWLTPYLWLPSQVRS